MKEWLFYQTWNFNGIGEMLVGQGYQIKIQDATNLTVVGDYMFPEENPIYLIEGWNLVAYLRLENAPVDAVFESLNSSGNLIVVKDDQVLLIFQIGILMALEIFLLERLIKLKQIMKIFYIIYLIRNLINTCV